MRAADYYDVEPEPRDREAKAAAWEDEAERRWEQARDDAVPEPALPPVHSAQPEGVEGPPCAR